MSCHGIGKLRLPFAFRQRECTGHGILAMADLRCELGTSDASIGKRTCINAPSTSVRTEIAVHIGAILPNR